MAQTLILTGANVLVNINGSPYKITQSITLDIDYGEEGIFGIDVPWAQEIAGNRATVRGSVKGLRIKNSGGLQAGPNSMRPLFQDVAASPYISIEIKDFTTGESILFIPNAKVIKETHIIATKSTYKLNFDFVGQIPYFALDRAQ